MGGKPYHYDTEGYLIMVGFKQWMVIGVIFIGFILAGCGNDEIPLSEEQLSKIMANCEGQNNNLKNAVLGYNMGKVSMLQKGRAVLMLASCIQEGGVPQKQAESIADKKLKEYEAEFQNVQPQD